MRTVKNVQIICLPYAGGNRYSFKGFANQLTDYLDFKTLELPGRGKRFKQPLLDDFFAMVDDIYQQILPRLDRDYILYGHSMGGILGNALIHKLKTNKKKTPLFFLVTGCSAPQNRKDDVILNTLNDFDFKKELNEMGGFPDEVLNNKELMSLLLPIIRADIIALEKVKYDFKEKHNVPIILGVGKGEELEHKHIYSWQLETTESLEVHIYEGNHFFILEHFANLAKIVLEKLSELKNNQILS